MNITRQNARAVFAAAVAGSAAAAAISAGLAAGPADAATTAASTTAATAATAPDITVSLSPTSGTSFTDNSDSLSWTTAAADASACDGNTVDAFLYRGTGDWNAAAISAAEGNDGAQSTYYGFSDTGSVTSANGSVAWPDAPGSYTLYGGSSAGTEAFASTSALVSALGSGVYTIGVACVSGTTFQPVLDGSGAPIAGSLQVNVSSSGAWSVASDAATVALTGSEASGAYGKVTLNAAVTAASGTPTGTVNFYEGGPTGTPLNSAPVAVSSTGTASWTGSAGNYGALSFYAVYTPAAGSADADATGTTSVNVLDESATVALKAVPDPSSASSVDVTATATATGNQAQSAFLAGEGLDVVVDGTPVSSFPVASFNSSGVATYTVKGLSAGSHTISAELLSLPQEPNSAAANGVSVTYSPASVSVSTGEAAATTTTLAGSEGNTGFTLTATVAAASGTASPTGTVAFSDGAKSLGTATLAADGAGKSTAKLVLTSLAAGTSDFSAAYASSSATKFTDSTGTLNVTEQFPLNYVQSSAVTVSGTMQVGRTLAVKSGTWGPSGVEYEYEWLANGAPLTGGLTSSLSNVKLVLGTAQYGKAISVEITGFKTGYTTVVQTSPKTVDVAKGTLTAAKPSISGTAKFGDTLHANTGTWTAGTKFSFKWLANGKAISGATGSSLKLTAGDEGKKIQVEVTGTKTDYTSVTETSNATKAVAK
jgi:hypothetical protein